MQGLKGFLRGVVYPIIALLLGLGLQALLHTDWLTVSGATVLTGLVAILDHKYLGQ